MPTLNGTMPYESGPELPCVWCSRPTDLRFEPAGMPSLGPLPLHLTCGMSLLRAYERFLRGEMLDGWTTQRLASLGQSRIGHAVTVSD